MKPEEALCVEGEGTVRKKQDGLPGQDAQTGTDRRSDRKGVSYWGSSHDTGLGTDEVILL